MPLAPDAGAIGIYCGDDARDVKCVGAETQVRDTETLRRLFGFAAVEKRVNHKIGKRNHYTPAQRSLIIPF
jgi:hypothetical protein